MGRDDRFWAAYPRKTGFNSRARMGRDGVDVLDIARWLVFQFTRPHGARRRPHSGNNENAVSIHAPAWGATPADKVQVVSDAFQFTRPHGARHVAHGVAGLAALVSIHAPAWGATGPTGWTWLDGGVSIHAPAWGATFLSEELRHLLDVSIHAPAWGATRS